MPLLIFPSLVSYSMNLEHKNTIQDGYTSCLAYFESVAQGLSMRPKTEQPTKHWKYRGDTKKVGYRLPVDTVDKIDQIAKERLESKAQIIIEAVDMMASVAHLKGGRSE